MPGRLMKDSGVEWANKIPSSWKVGKVKHGFNRKKSEAHQEDPVVLSLARAGVKVRDISNNEGQIAESYYNYNPVEIDDLLLNPMDLYSGANCSISKVEGVISPAYANLRYKSGFHPRYYDYCFKMQYWLMYIFSYGKGVSFDNRWTLNNETLMNMPLLIPPYEEQEAIANYLDKKCDKIDTAIEENERATQELISFKQSIIEETIKKSGNKTIKMKYLLSVHSGDGITNSQISTNDICPVYGGGELMGYTNNYNVSKGDLIVGRVGARCGCVTIIKENSWATDNALIIKTKEKPEYMYYLLISANLNRMNTANAQPLITGTKIKNKVVDYTESYKEQEKIANFLDEKCGKVEAIISEKEELIKDLESYKKSLIYECVTGKREVM